MENKSQLVVINSYRYYHEVGIPMSLLESEGIHVELVDLTSNESLGFNSSVLGSVKLAVDINDQDKAIDILIKNQLMPSKKSQLIVVDEIRGLLNKIIDGSNAIMTLIFVILFVLALLFLI